MPKSSDGPSATPPGNPPSGTAGGTGLCCACPASGAISRVVSTYFSCAWDPASDTTKGRIEMDRTTTGGTVRIKKTFKLSYSDGATAAANSATVTTAIQTAMSNWTQAARNWRVEIKQPGCGTQKLRMRIESEIVTSGQNVSVDVSGLTTAGLRSFMSDAQNMVFYVNGGGNVNWTMTHEIGHSFTLPDEYTYNRPSATPVPTVTYKAASDPDMSVSLSASAIPPDAPGQHAFDRATIMGQSGNTTYEKQHFLWIAIETQRLLADNGVTAEVRIVPN